MCNDRYVTSGIGLSATFRAKKAGKCDALARRINSSSGIEIASAGRNP